MTQHKDNLGTEGGARPVGSTGGLETPVEKGEARTRAARRLLLPVPVRPSEPPGSTAGDPAPAPGSFSITIPLTITVSLGSPGGAAPLGVTAPPAGRQTPERIEEGLRVDSDWSTRTGYDRAFLGEDVPLPRIPRELEHDTVEVPERYRKDGRRFILDYHHFSVAMRKSRGFAWFSAANIDGRRKSRPALPKRRNDEWRIDPRIDDPDNYQFQCGEELYATAKTDRGHLTRYLDVAWGATVEEALFAAADSFHFTNACLQLSGFNQGKDRWQGLETFLLERFAREEQRLMSVFTGPVFRDTDPYYQNEYMGYSIPVPLAFWKVCVIRRADATLSATAFVMGQEDVKLLPGFEERFEVAPTQRTIAQIEELTGLCFGPLRDHDHFARGGAPGTLETSGTEAGPAPRPLGSLRDIIV